MSCILRIGGENFDVDEFIQKTEMEWEQKTHKGMPVVDGFKRISKTSFVSVTTSDADFANYKEQIEETVEYLNKHKNSLLHIISTTGIDYAIIDFGVNIKEGYAMQCSELGIGIDISTYNILTTKDS
jgi:hypothetical protein